MFKALGLGHSQLRGVASGARPSMTGRGVTPAEDAVDVGHLGKPDSKGRSEVGWELEGASEAKGEAVSSGMTSGRPRTSAPRGTDGGREEDEIRIL